MGNLAVLHLDNGSDLTELIIREDMTLAAYSFDDRQWVELGKLQGGDFIAIAHTLYTIGMKAINNEVENGKI